MKKLLAASAILLALLAALFAQEGPGSIGSETVARPRRPAVSDTPLPAAPGPRHSGSHARPARARGKSSEDSLQTRSPPKDGRGRRPRFRHIFLRCQPRHR